MKSEINTIDLAIKNLDASSVAFLDQSYTKENYNTDYGEFLSEWSHEMWRLSREMKNFKDQYVM